MNEVEVIAKVNKGATSEFETLVQKYQGRIYTLCRYLLKSPQDAEDAAQDTFLKAFQGLKGFTPTSAFYTWLYRIAVNASLTFLKRRGREKGRTPFHENLPVGGSGRAIPGGPEGGAAATELAGRIREAVAALPDHFRATFALVVDQGLSHADAARALGCTENTVSWRMHKARKLLQARLRSVLEEVRS